MCALNARRIGVIIEDWYFGSACLLQNQFFALAEEGYG